MSQVVQPEIFISYAHRDNLSFQLREEDRWITNLHKSLQIRVGQLLGEDIGVWLDNKELRGDDYFDDVIFNQIKNIPIMVCVLSPSYNKSHYCKMELREFHRSAEQDGGLRLGSKRRIFKVVKTYVPPAEHPVELQGMLGYEFYKKEELPRKDVTSWQEFRPSVDLSYWDKLEDLARDITERIKLVRNGASQQPLKVNAPEAAAERPPAPVPPLPSRVSIYLAETTFELSLERDRIKRELLERNFEVLPAAPLPTNVSAITEAIGAQLKSCKLSIHLVGNKYGIIPEGDEDEDRSLQRIQCDLAAERCADADFSRLIWMPVGLEPESRRQREFVQYLKANASAQGDTELLQTSLEELKTVIQDKLYPKPKPSAKPRELSGAGPDASLRDEPVDDGIIHIYLICDQRDFDNVQSLADYVYNFDDRFQVDFPPTEGSEAEVHAAHKDSLSTCDAALIYYGHGNEFWLRSKVDDLLKSRYGKDKRLMATAIYMTAPVTRHKKIYRVRDPLLIMALDHAEGSFAPELLAPFLNQIEVAKGGRKCG